MHLLALVGRNGIGRLGFQLPGAPEMAPTAPMGKAALLRLRHSPELFDDLVAADLSTGAGIASMLGKLRSARELGLALTD